MNAGAQLLRNENKPSNAFGNLALGWETILLEAKGIQSSLTIKSYEHEH